MICKECQQNVEEINGRSVIIGERLDGFEWIFLCIHCVRDWRQRGLEREGNSPEDIKIKLDKEYPVINI
ncbi:MAG: hypothetical protein CMM67_10865 [Rhodospirillaceae bacterium]|nr:hypothetical protein [Rhodospirillaceae bacterium]OUT76070.1 MAG: hypothetical protein CBB83_11045 [Rhodospirillaceae bacterium TMED23]|tara:strand:+ start:1445 stop:1651 length:207 start_codon:yes stop_codon:yes gene_type:complete